MEHIKQDEMRFMIKGTLRAGLYPWDLHCYRDTILSTARLP